MCAPVLLVPGVMIQHCMQSLLNNCEAMSNGELLRAVESLAGRERQATVELVAHVAELDRRKLYREQGYASLFSYCTGALGLSEHATFNRIEAARASRAFPIVLDRLADGSVNLSTVRLLAPHLTDENHQRLLAEAKGRSKREVEAIVARLAPRADVASSVRKLPSSADTAAVPLGLQVPAAVGRSADSKVVGAPSPQPMLRPHRPVIAPLASERYRVQFTVDRQTQERLRRIQDLLRREIPDGDPGVIFERALRLLEEDVARRKLAATTKPRPSIGADPRSRRVPAEVRRKVWLRDHGQCAFVSPGGRRCRERTFLEFHHVKAYGLGGDTTADNLSLRCRAHNVYEAELLFGRDPEVRESRVSYSTWSGSVATTAWSQFAPGRVGILHDLP